MGQLMLLFRCLGCDDTGAVTTDWVAASSLSLLLGMMVGYAVFNIGVSSLVVEVNALIVSADDIDPGTATPMNDGG